jgi:catabolite regulation protein CreA
MQNLNKDNTKSFKEELEKANIQLSNFKEKFSDAKIQLTQHAKVVLSEHTKHSQTQIEKEVHNKNIDMSSFSQPDINNIAGHFVASQANAQQASGARLLY